MHLLHVIEARAEWSPEQVAFTFHNDPPCTYGELWQEIKRCGRYLRRHCLKKGDRVIIAIGNSPQFFHAFYGVQRAGGIAVPVFPGSGEERIIRLADLCGAAFILISATFPDDKTNRIKELAVETGLKLLVVEERKGPATLHSNPEVFPDVHPNDVAMIQFTSGSLGNPKGVPLTHANLVTNMKQMIRGMGISSEDLFVSWLPVYHDMGLILMTMVPFFLGIDLVVLPSGLNYLKTWLQTIQQRRASFTAAPDFAYRLCLIYIRDPDSFDLSSLRVALNAAEPVRASTIRRFEERFRLKNVMLPAYGLAEATVGVCSWRPGKRIKVDRRGFVSVGSPFPGIRIRISRGEPDHAPADTGEMGEILVKSPANTSAYFRNPAATEKLLTQDGYIRTGDLGYVDSGGDYYIVGRKKSIIIQGGFNIAAREVEEWVDAFPFVRRSAAVGIDRGGAEGEQVYVFIELHARKSRWRDPDQLVELTVEVVQKFKQTFGFNPGRVYLLKPRAIPVTPNGKIRYPQLKDRYYSGSLKTDGLVLFPPY